jgi:hypothetical protein
MAAGLGYKEFTTGDVLTAADANGYLASQVVMVFASAAARTSGIASPQEGMISFLKDTNSTEYYSGSAWVAIAGAASSPALILTGSADFTTSSAVNINNCFSATYLNYLVLINLTAVSATDSDLSVRLRVGGADNTSSNYYDNTYQNNGSTAGGNRVNAATSWGFGNMASSKATQLATQATFLDPFSSITTKVLSQSNRWNSSDNNQFLMVNEHRVASSFDGVSFIPSSGTISGKIRIYGYTLS